MVLLDATNSNFTKTGSNQLIDNNTKLVAYVHGLFDLMQLVDEMTRGNVEATAIIVHIIKSCARNIMRE